ncbi:hypothetical protein Cci01nite_71850 [Catellatospora citrea]|uniref:Reverse transcriptase domain-containing protein n=3 Tax=Catellatospora citrea TaxID=53366 RepID=A0A8J3KLP3_9ACTN|nr:reverse transcriptase (RNA-dependent DNA polymerase) [Catellatospora citrea]GIG02092.1 hypothetical protein Cci01nite_71850 [Catellatospora citrea]
MRRSSAPGADGMSWAAYRKGMRARLADLAARIHSGQWTPGPLRTVQLTSYAGKQFPAVIPTVEDRIVHRALRHILDPILDAAVLADWVSGYRPGRNRITALRQVDAHLHGGSAWLADVDVAAASAGSSAQELTGWLAQYVQDGSFLALFRRAVEGLPSPLVPGSGLWPVLFQLRLAQADARLGHLRVVRFADNYIACARSGDEAATAVSDITQALAVVGLAPNARKTQIRPPYLALAEDLFLIDG